MLEAIVDTLLPQWRRMSKNHFSPQDPWPDPRSGGVITFALTLWPLSYFTPGFVYQSTYRVICVKLNLDWLKIKLNAFENFYLWLLFLNQKPANGRQRISRPMWIVAPIHFFPLVSLKGHIAFFHRIFLHPPPFFSAAAKENFSQKKVFFAFPPEFYFLFFYEFMDEFSSRRQSSVGSQEHIFSRPGQSQGLLYKHLCYWLIHSIIL